MLHSIITICMPNQHMRETIGTNPLLEDDQGISGPWCRFKHSGIVHVKNGNYLHIMLRKNDGAALTIGSSSDPRLDVVSQLYLCEI